MADANDNYIIIYNNYINENNRIISPYIINYIYRDISDFPEFNFRLPIHLPIFLPRFVEEEIEISEDAKCGITFERPDCITSCGHFFCRADITTWLEKQKNEGRKMTCPSCRSIVTKVSLA